MFRKTTIIKGLIILLAIGALATWGWASWQIAKEKQIAKEEQLTKEEKEKRIPAKKEIKEEKEPPKISEEFIPKQDISKITEIEEIPIESFDASTWNVYRNEEFGFEIRYPEKGKIVLVDEFAEFDVPYIVLDPEGDNNLPPREPLPSKLDAESVRFWEFNNRYWRHDDDIGVLIFSSIEKLRDGMVRYGGTNLKLSKPRATLEEILEANIKDFRFEKQFLKGRGNEPIYVRKIKIGDKIGYQFIDKFYFPTFISWRGEPDNYSIIFSPPNNKIYWIWIGNQATYINDQPKDTPQLKLFFKILYTLRFLD